MASLSALESHDLLRFAEQLRARLLQAQQALEPKRGLKREKEWLGTALAVVDEVATPVSALLERCRGLPELAEVAREGALDAQGRWVDVLERLVAGITFHISGRSPLIESLFPHQKFPALRKAGPEQVREYLTEFDRRRGGGYVTRMLASDEFAFALPVLEQIATARAAWEACFNPVPMDEALREPLRDELVSAGKRADLAIRQAKLIAEAALAPVANAFDEAGLGAKPRKRSARPAGEAPWPATAPAPAAADSSDAGDTAATPEPQTEPAAVAQPEPATEVAVATAEDTAVAAPPAAKPAKKPRAPKAAKVTGAEPAPLAAQATEITESAVVNEQVTDLTATAGASKAKK